MCAPTASGQKMIRPSVYTVYTAALASRASLALQLERDMLTMKCHVLSHITIWKYDVQWKAAHHKCIHSPAPRCGTIASVAFILWRVKQAANKLCWFASICKYNTQGS
jgi:hypothetical protein